MKLSGGRIEAFLRDPDPAVRAALVYGPDSGLVRERATLLVGRVAGDVSDPFRVAELGAEAVREDPARLADECAALSLTGGRRVVRVRGAGDREAPLFESVFEAPAGGAFVVAEAGELGPRSSLRRLFEQAADAAALPCYADDKDALDRLISATLAAEGLRVEPTARAYLVERLGADRLLSRQELEKLVLYLGPEAGGGRTATLEDVMAACGDSAALSLDDVASAAADGDQAALERTLARAWLSGNAPVTVLRAVARHVARLHLASAWRDGGMPPAEAAKRLRPPVFFKQMETFRRHLNLWSTDRLARALEIIIEAERDCKRTGAPAETICARALSRLAAAARAGRAAPRHSIMY